MFLGILVLITALSISAVAIYYSVAGLVAIFAAAAIPIMIMGSALEIGKLVTAVWLHKYWHEARLFLKVYLSLAVLILMFITSMGIFGFLSRAHIEQTANATEGLAQIERIDDELIRLNAIIDRAEQRIQDAEASVGEGNTAVQEQIDREQSRIDNAYDRIQPAIDEQIAIVNNARDADSARTAPFETQLAQLDVELQRMAVLVNEYETRLDNLNADTATVDRLLSQIDQIEENIIVTSNRLQSNETAQIRVGQTTIGVSDDGVFGANTRRALATWIQAQQERISELEAQAADLRLQAQSEIDRERTRLVGLIDNIKGPQTQALKQRQIDLLATIDEVRSTESPVVQRARDEISRIRAGADAQIAASNELIQRLRDSLTVGTDPQVEAVVEEQQQKIIEANNSIDTLTEQKYTLQAEYRKLEAEVGPIKYLAEFVYGDTADKDLLEEAVRWVIIVIIFVFDPLAVLLLIASQATFEMLRAKKKETDGESVRLEKAEHIGSNPKSSQADNEEEIDDNTDGPSNERNNRQYEVRRIEDAYIDRNLADTHNSGDDSGGDEKEHKLPRAADDRGVDSAGMDESRQQEFVSIDPGEIAVKYTDKKKDIESSEDLLQEKLREEEYYRKEQQEDIALSKTSWKKDHPDQTLKHFKHLYVKGVIDQLPWEGYSSKDNYTDGYVQNSEQNENSLFNKIRRENDKSD